MNNTHHKYMREGITIMLHEPNRQSDEFQDIRLPIHYGHIESHDTDIELLVADNLSDVPDDYHGLFMLSYADKKHLTDRHDILGCIHDEQMQGEGFIIAYKRFDDTDDPHGDDESSAEETIPTANDTEQEHYNEMDDDCIEMELWNNSRRIPVYIDGEGDGLITFNQQETYEQLLSEQCRIADQSREALIKYLTPEYKNIITKDSFDIDKYVTPILFAIPDRLDDRRELILVCECKFTQENNLLVRFNNGECDGVFV